MTKTELRQIAKNVLTESVGVAYYKIADENAFNEEEKEQIIQYINQYGAAMCKAIKERYVAY